MSLAFLCKKGWHTSGLQNVEKVWIAEQKVCCFVLRHHNCTTPRVHKHVYFYHNVVQQKKKEERMMKEYQRQLREELEVEETQKLHEKVSTAYCNHSTLVLQHGQIRFNAHHHLLLSCVVDSCVSGVISVLRVLIRGSVPLFAWHYVVGNRQKEKGKARLDVRVSWRGQEGPVPF